jgi:ABC-2 type transport system ATP-binding protein
MRTIATLQEPDAGTIRFNGLDVLQDKDAVRRMLGYLPQEFGVYPKVSPETMLNHFAILKGITNAKERKEAVEALLHQTNLWDVRKEKLGNFSGGMKQRFGIAQALLGNPKLIIVDEPTAGLDPAERVRFHNLLSEIGENIVVILSTHIVEDVSDLCSLMAVISRGEVLLTGEPGKTIDLLRGRVWKKIIARTELKDYETRFHVISTHLLAGKTVIHILSDGPPDQTFTEVSPDLEDVYFSTLKKSA